MMTASPFGQHLSTPMATAFPTTPSTIGTDVLSQLFGSKEVSQAVAAQAAATSGVSQAILKQMLPVIAAMVMGGLFKSTSNEGLGGILGQFAEMMPGKMPGQQPPRPAAAAQAPANPLDGGNPRRHVRRTGPGARRRPDHRAALGGGQMPGGNPCGGNPRWATCSARS